MRRKLRLLVGNLATAAVLYICLGLVLTGCFTVTFDVTTDPGFEISIGFPVSECGTYLVEYKDKLQELKEVYATCNAVGVISIPGSTSILNVEGPFDGSQARPSLTMLWPPDGRMVDISVEDIPMPSQTGASDLRINRVLQDEPTTANADGTCPDAIIVDRNLLRLRAERSGSGNGRVYTIPFTLTGSDGSIIYDGSVKVCVALTEADQCVDDGANFDSTVCASGADLSVTKSGSPDPATVGSALAYTITVRNNGPDAATNVKLVDLLPVTLRVIRVQASQGTYSLVDQALVFEIGGLASGAEAKITIEVNPTRAGSITNTAFVNATGSDPDTANNSTSATNTVNP
jgi:uncharacterized repeat protein (TIGR01451 family)